MVRHAVDRLRNYSYQRIVNFYRLMIIRTCGYKSKQLCLNIYIDDYG